MLALKEGNGKHFIWLQHFKWEMSYKSDLTPFGEAGMMSHTATSRINCILKFLTCCVEQSGLEDKEGKEFVLPPFTKTLSWYSLYREIPCYNPLQIRIYLHNFQDGVQSSGSLQCRGVPQATIVEVTLCALSTQSFARKPNQARGGVGTV